MQRGTVDAIATSSSFGLSNGMADVSKFYNVWKVSSGYSGGIIVNKKSWNALPADLQKIVRDVAKEMQSQTFYAAYVAERESEVGIKAARLGFIVPEKAEMDKAKAATKGVYDKWLGVAGADAKAVLDIAFKYGTGAPK